MAVGEVFLGAIITVLLDKLASSEFMRFLNVEGLDSQMQKCSDKLEIIQGVLLNAERRDSEDVTEKWLDKLQVLALDLEDIVDELSTETLREVKASIKKVHKFKISSCTAYAKNHKMDSKIKQICLRLDELVNQIKIINLVESSLGNVGKSRNQEKFADATTSLVNEPEIVGRKNDKDQIVELLLQIGSTYVIGIVGMGGIGKTTLAQLVYNDDRVEKWFQLRAWICVSDDFNVFNITKAILTKFSDENDLHFQDLDSLQRKLRDTVAKKRFLLVLDDVWNEDDAKWEGLFKPLVCSFDHGSKIIVTTRENRVPQIMLSGQGQPYFLTKLDDEDALSLLAQFAFRTRNFELHPQLKDLGQKLVKKCENLPLAIKHLGRFLSTKLNYDDWQEVLNSEIWVTEPVRGKVLPSLKLSYNRLPPHLKQCFAYCSIFPKGYEFSTHELVLLWMAQGFLEQGKEKNKSLEELGEDWFKELVSRSFFEQSSSNTSMFVMHDFIHELARHVARKICFVLKDDESENDVDDDNIVAFARHSSYTCSKYELFSKFKVFHKAKRIRTFLPVSGIHPYCFVSNQVLVELLPRLECLRVLSLHGYLINELPDSIANLKHLRYLDLSKTRLQVLPESITTLCNLQTLSLRGCWYLRKLPSGMQNLVSLRHLDVSGTPALHEMPVEIGELINLRTLSKIIISKTGMGGFNLKSLGNLPFLRGKISITGLSLVTSRHDALAAKLGDKSYFDDIELSWDYIGGHIRDVNLEFEVLDSLRPKPVNVKLLKITGYGGSEFPSWVGEPTFFTKLVDLQLSFACNCASLPSLGQLPSLKNLRIEGMDKVTSVGNEFYGADGLSSSNSYFPSLEKLKFSDMKEWNEWSGLSSGELQYQFFRRLQELSLSNCPKLMNVQLLPLPSLCRLSLYKCRQEIMRSLTNLTSLTEMFLWGIVELTSLSDAFVQFPLALEHLSICFCEKLSKLWPTGDIAQNLKQLRKVRIEACPQLVSVEDMSSLPSLDGLEIQVHPPMKNLFRGGKFPATLKNFQVSYSDELEEILEPVLENCCNSLECLSINKWMQFKFTALFGSTLNFVRLSEIDLWACDGIESFPESGFSTPNLRSLLIGNCQNLKSLKMNTLPSLTNLRLEECGNLDAFPQEDLPPKLITLSISDCHMLKPLSDWGLCRLTSLSAFQFRGCDSNNIEEREFCDLPPTLLELSISHLPKLEYLLPGSMEHLTSLQRLDVSYCPKLKYLPKNLIKNLTSLQMLDVSYCPKLEHLPKALQDLTSIRHICFRSCPKLRSVAALEGLQDKLWILEIKQCPILNKRCRKNKGNYWPFIANIPRVYQG